MLIASDQSMAASFDSEETNIQHYDNIIYQINVKTGSPQGTVNIEVSNDFDPHLDTGNWQSLGSDYDSTIDGTGQGVFDLNQLPFKYARLVYTRTSGTGTCDIYVGAKGL